MLVQDECAEILRQTKVIAEKNRVKIFLIYGTCLGMVREGDFIIDDTDIDIGVYGEDPNIDKFWHELRRDRQFREEHQEGRQMYYRLMTQHTLDINPLYLQDDKRYYLKKYNQDDKSFLAKEFDRKHFDNLDTITYRGEKYFIPSYVEEYLEFLYGNWKQKAPTGTSNLRPLVKIKLRKEQDEKKDSGFHAQIEAVRQEQPKMDISSNRPIERKSSQNRTVKRSSRKHNSTKRNS